MKVQCMDLPASTSQGLSTTLGWSGSPKPYNSSKRVGTNFPVALQLQAQTLRGLWIGCFGAGSPPSPEAFSLKSRSGEADGNRGREPDAEPRNGISLATPSRTLIWTIRDSVHPLPQPTAHHPPSQPAGLCTPPSRPQGEPKVPRPPDADQWNAGVRTFPEVSPGRPPPANQHCLGSPPASRRVPTRPIGIRDSRAAKGVGF